MRGNVVPVRTDPAVDFTGTLVQNASATLNLRLPLAIGAGGHCRSILRHLVIASLEQRAWELVLFARRSFQTAPIGQSAFIGAFRFAAADGRQYGSSPYYYQAQNIDLPYFDFDFEDRDLPADQRGGFLHLMLINRSPDAKSAGAGGALQLACYLEPTYG